ncbi:hypothetical protein [Flavobacterium anhuiense]|uniref:hypothetical protein n=1 Tax=Flavobacterium anhuiense TaxID=459526 RepID=UPI0013C524BC|nr:hypothetical protein [Flavobacterium anhuiense]
MNNNTLEDLYKKAIKEKYEEVKNGDDFYFLNAPTRGKLNKLCWEKFANNDMHSNDLNVFNSLLGLSFDISSKKKFKQETDLFRPVEKFFKGETDPDKIDVVDMAAILVDFNPRPFNKFRKEIDPENLKLIEELRNTKHYKPEISPVGFSDEVEIENFADSKNEEVEIDKSEKVEKEEEVKHEEVQQDENQNWETITTGIVDASPPANGGKDVWRDGIKKYFLIIVFLTVLSVIMYLSMSQKDCMQWRGDRYEKIERSDEGYCDTYYDARYFNLRKIDVCDTTKFFDDNGRAKVFYIKIGDSIECYNQSAPYPENTQRFLKPITKHMIDKYLSNRPKCK